MGNASCKNYTSKTDMKSYYNSVLYSLRTVIVHSTNKKIVNIVPINNDPYLELQCDKLTKKGIIIKYDNGETFELSCDSVETGAIMWFYDVENKMFTNYIDGNFQKYIKKKL